MADPDTVNAAAAVPDAVKAYIIAQAVSPWTGNIRDINSLPDDGPLAMVFTAGFNSAMGLVSDKLGSSGKLVVTGRGISEDFEASFASVVQGVSPTKLDTLQAAAATTLGPDAGAVTTAAPSTAGDTTLNAGEVANVDTVTITPVTPPTVAEAPAATTGGEATPAAVVEPVTPTPHA